MMVDLEQLIDKYSDLINECKFTELYDSLSASMSETQFRLTVSALFALIHDTMGDEMFSHFGNTIPSYVGRDITATSIEIPKGITIIDDSAFIECTSLVSVSLPEGLVRIGDSAFADCYNLRKVTIPKSVTEINSFAFSSCRLSEVFLSKNVTTVGNYAFADNFSLTLECEAEDKPEDYSAHWASAVPTVIMAAGTDHSYEYSEPEFLMTGTVLVQYNGVQAQVSVPEGTTAIAPAAFAGNNFVEIIELPESLRTIEEEAFCGCTSLEKIVIPNSVTYVGSDAVVDCEKLTVYCEVGVDSTRWSAQWNPDRRPVQWNYDNAVSHKD